MLGEKERAYRWTLYRRLEKKGKKRHRVLTPGTHVTLKKNVIWK
jgi:hypothetical protein